MFDHEYIAVERAMMGDTIYIRIKDIRAITGAVNEHAVVIEGAATIYMEGELGFVINMAPADFADLLRARSIVN